MDRDGVVEVEPDGLDERLGFEGLAEALEVIDLGVRRDVEGSLGDDRALVEVGRHVVGGHASDPDALFERLEVGLGAGEGGQERRMDVDDPALVAKDDVRREDAHVAGQHHEVGVVLAEEIQQVFFVGIAPFVADVVERDVVALGQRLEVGVVADDDAHVGAEVAAGPGLEDGFEAVGLFGDQDGDLLGLAVGGEPDLDVDAEFRTEVVEVVAQRRFRTDHLAGVDVHRHPEDALADGLVQVFDVDAPLEEQGRDFGDQPGVVVPHDGDLGELATHGVSPPGAGQLIIGFREARDAAKGFVFEDRPAGDTRLGRPVVITENNWATSDTPQPGTGGDMSDASDLAVVCVDPDPDERAETAAAIDAEPDMVAEPLGSADAALDRVRDGEVDCLVAEHDLPNGTGIDLFERARERAPGLGCVLFTEEDVTDLDRAAFGDVVAEYLPKRSPNGHDRLQDLVRNVVVNRFHVGYPVPADEDARLAAVRSYDVPELSTVETFDPLTRLIANHFDIAVAFVGLIDERDEEFLACHGADWGTLSREDSVCTYAILEDDLTVIEHVQDDPRFEANETLKELEVRSYAGANLTSPEGHTVGQLCLIHDEPRAYTDAELADLQLFADEVMEQLEMRRRLRDGSDGPLVGE